MRRLEEKYPDRLAVVGVHAGKYTAERSTSNIRDAVLRLGIDHPVVNDRQFRIWKAYAVSAWPTVVIVGPNGYYLGTNPGEITFEDFDPVIASALAHFEQAGMISAAPLPLHPEHLDEPERPLRYPGKVLAVAGSDGTPDRLFIADSDHARVLGARLSVDGRAAEVEWVAGSGAPGADDGPFEQAGFNRPQGMSLVADTLYIADSENHTLRALDTGKRTVRTIAGTGQIGRFGAAGGAALSTPLNSPWDLAWTGNRLYIAMAGYHQLWVYDPAGTVAPFAGTGREELADGRLWSPSVLKARVLDDLRGYASLAQPTGIVADGERLYFTCSEAQAVRSVSTGGENNVSTFVGTGLFDFGDKDGRGDAVRLQHPFGLAFHEGRLLVADTYNSKIKRLDPATREAASWLGNGERGLVDGPGADARFNEPEGLSVAGNRLYIADTNNHAIRVVDLTDPAGNVSTLELRGL